MIQVALEQLCNNLFILCNAIFQIFMKSEYYKSFSL